MEMTRNSIHLYQFIKIIVVLSAAALLLSGCKAEELSFETIEKIELGDTSRQYEGQDPKLVVLTSAGEARLLERGVSQQAQAALEALDYERYFAIAILQGKKGTTGYSVQIESLRLSDNTITVRADLNDPMDNLKEVVREGTTSPYHLVKVPREGLHGAYEFVLEVDGEALESETRSFP